MGARDDGSRLYRRAAPRHSLLPSSCSLLVSETTGALSGDTVRMLLALAKQAQAPTTHDSTCYGNAKQAQAPTNSYLPPNP